MVLGGVDEASQIRVKPCSVKTEAQLRQCCFVEIEVTPEKESERISPLLSSPEGVSLATALSLRRWCWRRVLECGDDGCSSPLVEKEKERPTGVVSHGSSGTRGAVCFKIDCTVTLI